MHGWDGPSTGTLGRHRTIPVAAGDEGDIPAKSEGDGAIVLVEDGADFADLPDTQITGLLGQTRGGTDDSVGEEVSGHACGVNPGRHLDGSSDHGQAHPSVPTGIGGRAGQLTGLAAVRNQRRV